MLSWKLHNNGILVPGAAVAPTERLDWGRTIRLGAQYVVTMFGTTFMFLLLIELNPQLAVMMSGITTLTFLFVVEHRVPDYLGLSASFAGIATTIYSAGGNPATLSDTLFVIGLTLFTMGLIIHFAGARVIHKILPPVVTGAVVMLIGFNLAPVVANTYWPQDPWLTSTVIFIVIAFSVGLCGFLGRIAIFLSLVTGYILSWVFNLTFGPMRSTAADGTVTEKMRVDWSAVEAASWFNLPSIIDLANWRFSGVGNIVGFHLPQFSLGAIIIALPVVITLIAENAGHVKTMTGMTGENLDLLMRRAVAADGGGSMLATLVGAGPATTYAKNIGVVAVARVYSTVAYVVASLMAVCFGLSPKFGAVISATPGAVLGRIYMVLYGVTGLLGVRIWEENHVNSSNPISLTPAAAGIIIGIGDMKLPITEGFTLGGIALGTIVVVAAYYVTHAVAPRELREAADGASLVCDAPEIYSDDMSDAATVSNRPADQRWHLRHSFTNPR